MRKLTPFLMLAATATVLPNVAAADVGNGSGEDVHIWAILTLAAAVAIYARGICNIRARSVPGHVAGTKEIAAFVAGVAVTIVAIEPRLERLGKELFSLHMAQHLMLMLICAPLFVLARPSVVTLWATPRRMRRSLSHVWRRSRLAALSWLFVSPVAIWLWFIGLFAFWHLPGPYALALRNEAVHALEHLCFFLSAYAFWSIVLEPFGRRRMDYGATLLFVATAAISSGLPGALISLASRPLYAIHMQGAARFGLTVVEDQQLAGLLMWVPAGFAYMAAILFVLFEWLRHAERRAEARLRSSSTIVLACLVLSGVLTACREDLWERTAPNSYSAGFGGDPSRGAKEITRIGCGACHTIPGIVGADGLVGPPLTQMGRRVFIAGLLRNTPDNLMMWLRDPQRIAPGNAMPDMGLTEDQSRDIAAYLYALR